MASPHACTALVDVFPDVLRLKRVIASAASVDGTAALAALADLGTPRPSNLATRLGLDLSTVSRQVTHLRQRGLVATCQDPTDGRSQRLSLTEAGTRELSRGRAALADELAARLSDWSDADVEELAQLLHRMTTTTLQENA